MLCHADSIGVFQVESRAQMSMLPRLRPREFFDLVIEVAIVRPGPIQGDMVHPYLRRRMGLEPVTHPKGLEDVLKHTYGVPLFQEQAMKIAMIGAGFTAGEADGLRRAMATFKRNGDIDRFEKKFIAGMVANNYERDFALRCFEQIKGFSDYGFPLSHAASFALLVYVSAWLKRFYPEVFACALLNSQPMGFYAPAQIVRDAQNHDVELRPVDVNHSDWDCTLEPASDDGRRALRLGFRQVKGLAETEIRDKLVAQRLALFRWPAELQHRTGLSRGALERLADADAFRSMGLDRRQALWAVKGLEHVKPETPLPLLAPLAAGSPELPAPLPAMGLGEQVVEDYRATGLSLKRHPLALLRPELAARRILRNAQLATAPPSGLVKIAGLAIVRQQPATASGVIFMTLEDETGIANIVVWRKVFERFRPVVMGAKLVEVTGRLQREGEVIHVVAGRLTDLSPLLRRLGDPVLDAPVELRIESRDFR
jgi:error-prone DNA polymerase